jgi:hypothetical protein
MAVTKEEQKDIIASLSDNVTLEQLKNKSVLLSISSEAATYLETSLNEKVRQENINDINQFLFETKFHLKEALNYSLLTKENSDFLRRGFNENKKIDEKNPNFKFLANYLRLNIKCGCFSYEKLANQLFNKDKNYKGDIATIEKWLEVTKKLKSQDVDNRLYFRGEPGIYPSMRSSLAREYSQMRDKLKTNSAQDTQMEIIGRLSRLSPMYTYNSIIESNPCDFYEELSIVQHHGLKTFLIDFSLNPMISLYFSVEEFVDKDCDAKIWVMKLRKKDEREALTHYSNASIGTISQNNNVSAFSPTRAPSLVVPRLITKRIDAQSGRFVYFQETNMGLDEYNEMYKNDTNPEKMFPWEELSYYWIPGAARQSIQKDLAMLRIHRGTVYADLDSYAMHINKAESL